MGFFPIVCVMRFYFSFKVGVSTRHVLTYVFVFRVIVCKFRFDISGCYYLVFVVFIIDLTRMAY